MFVSKFVVVKPKSCRVIKGVLVFLALNWFTWHQPKEGSLITQVEAILKPPTRICFNSMSTSFQSECVYCDSRLYASTITACTGQPNLANNVTQAEAFCIATACLQVTVLSKKSNPFEGSKYFFEPSKLNRFFKPSLLFGARQMKWNVVSPRARSLNNHHPEVGGFNLDKIDFFLPTGSSTFIQEKSDRSMKLSIEQPAEELELEQPVNDPMPEKSNLDAGDPPNQTTSSSLPVENPPSSLEPQQASPAPLPLPPPSSPTIVANTVPPAVESTTTMAPNLPVPVSTIPATSATDKSRPVDYPNFNQMYAQIYTRVGEQTRPFLWKPQQHITPPPPATQVTQANNRIVQILRRASLASLWQRLGRAPVQNLNQQQQQQNING